MKDRYVILTGAKNNAGDYLIKHRAKLLLAALRPDREIIDFDGWKPLTDEQLEIINQSRALILTGGPALQFNMYPDVYPLRENLDDIHVPVITMAVGWKSREGSWEATKNYLLSESSVQLLQKIDVSEYRSSVRDYHTLAVLESYGFSGFDMTGCAGLYSLEHIGKGVDLNREIRKVSFSLGVNFHKNRKLDRVNKRLILGLRDLFSEAELTVVFHHSTDPEYYRKTHNPNLGLVEAQLELIAWLECQGISHVDISGSAETLMEHYSDCDLHVGYRVHAHIFMASISRMTVLIAEDGRGTALEKVLGGLVFDDCLRLPRNTTDKVLAKLGIFDIRSQLSKFLPETLIGAIEKELSAHYHKNKLIRAKIDKYYQNMFLFLEQLP